MSIEPVPTIPAEAIDAARRGLNWLKTEGRRRGLDAALIRIDTLNVRSIAGRCPLSQAAGGIGFLEIGLDVGEDWEIAHGFDLPVFSAEEDWGALNNAWIHVLTEDRLQQLEEDVAPVG